LCSDNGATAEGTLTGLFDEMSVFNAVSETIEENIERIDKFGGPTCYNHGSRKEVHCVLFSNQRSCYLFIET